MTDQTPVQIRAPKFQLYEGEVSSPQRPPLHPALKGRLT